ncbi:uncharacterized protein LOC132603527 [Lycium barbarum]|uniref:uncharacterized protein LOC132603527 n=1 Tax=Lycium barbarum TaxID=112863 RepID=UPI00293F62C4|nr:uncharacterized protein LOC132603527 [Lycium barbarum]
MVATRLSLARRNSLQLQQPATSLLSPTFKCHYKKRISLKACGLCTPTKAPAVPSPPVPPGVSNGNAPGQVSTSTLAPEVCTSTKAPAAPTIAPEQVPPPTVVPPGSSSERPLEIPGDEEEEERERKLNLNPLSRLEALKPTHTASSNESYPQMNEQSKNMITGVKSFLVSRLTSKTTANVEDMVNLAIGAFTMLKCLSADYGCFYRDVKDLISKKHNLQIEEKKGHMSSFPELENKYEEAVIRADQLQQDIKLILRKLKRGKEKMEPLKREIDKAEEEIRRKKQVVANIEYDVERLKRYEKNCEAYLKSAQAEIVKLATQVEAAETVKKEIEQRKIAARQEIASISERLLSTL